jgi:hypothetical protein
MTERRCGACELFQPDEPGGYDGRCRYFPPQPAVIEGRLAAVRAPVTADEGCHVGYRPLMVVPSLVVEIDQAALDALFAEARGR